MTFNVNVVPRICNRVPPALAAQGCEACEDDIMVMDIVPPCIRSIVHQMSNGIYFQVKKPI
jgi:hypothetical protein